VGLEFPAQLAAQFHIMAVVDRLEPMIPCAWREVSGVAVKEVREQATARMEPITQEVVVEVVEDFRKHRLVAEAGRVL